MHDCRTRRLTAACLSMRMGPQRCSSSSISLSATGRATGRYSLSIVTTGRSPSWCRRAAYATTVVVGRERPPGRLCRAAVRKCSIGGGGACQGTSGGAGRLAWGWCRLAGR
eukprot:358456-Chlamydomonas_euryale.AAC.8